MTTVDQTLRQLSVELRILEDTIGVLRRRFELVQTSILDFRRAGSTLEALKKMKVNQPALIPIGANSYVQAKISDVGKAIIHVGAQVYTEKDIDDATKYVGDRLSELEKAELSIRQQLATATQRHEEGSEKLYGLIQEKGEVARKT